MFRHFAWKYDKKVAACIYYSEEMSHKIYASSDAFLMPSLFEPCGLSQLMSLRYGTVPIVRETGGLKDTVEPYNEFAGTGTGFSFANYNAHEMLGTIRYAEQVYYDRKREWNKIVDRGMAKDFSWANSARQYEEMYNWLAGFDAAIRNGRGLTGIRGLLFFCAISPEGGHMDGQACLHRHGDI